MKSVFCLLVFLCVLSGAAYGRDALEDQKIDFLIASVAEMPDAKFIRNGSEYGAQQAADHMRMKLRYAGSRVRTAEDFILCCATGSSITGQPYAIKFPDGHTQSSADFLHERLAEFPAPTNAQRSQ